MYYILIAFRGHTKIVETDSDGNCLKESMWGNPLCNKTLADIVFKPLECSINQWLKRSNIESSIKTENFYDLKEQFPELFI